VEPVIHVAYIGLILSSEYVRTLGSVRRRENNVRIDRERQKKRGAAGNLVSD
jgi:hypothetical protein